MLISSKYLPTAALIHIKLAIIRGSYNKLDVLLDKNITLIKKEDSSLYIMQGEQWQRCI